MMISEKELFEKLSSIVEKPSSPEIDALNNIIRSRIVADGFRPGRAHEANVGKLLNPMINGFREHSEAVSAILKVWMKCSYRSI